MSKILVIAETQNGNLSRAMNHAVSAAQKIGGEVDVLVLSPSPVAANEAAKITGVAKVLSAEAAHFAHPLAEDVAPVIATNAAGYSHVVLTATSWGKDVAPRAAALLDTAQISEITEVISADTFRRPIYAGNVIVTVKSNEPTKLITVRKVSFSEAAVGTDAKAEIVKVEVAVKSPLSEFMSVEETKSERPELTSAKVVISGGRGLGTKENFTMLEKLADTLGAALGASRAAVDMGIAPNDWQVGQTGKVVAPDLYIAVGISGAIQHIAGMKESKVIVAINKDENAPIFQIADYGLVADLNSVVPELTEAIAKLK